MQVTEIKELLKLVGKGPNKSLGQNFLIDEKIINKIVSSVNPDLPLIEIGGGLGAVTLPLAKKVEKVLVIEKDETVAKILEKRLISSGFNNARVLVGDILDLKEEDVVESVFEVFSSLPYYITSPIIHKLVNDFHNRWESAVFLIQREVAEKIMSSPPNGNYWYFYLNYYYEVGLVKKTVKPSSFWPQPSVYSSVIKFVRKDGQKQIAPQKWSDALHRIFKSPRKQLGNVIEKSAIKNAGLSPTVRPGALSIEDMEKLVLSLQAVD